MKESLQKIMYYIGIPLTITAAVILIFTLKFNDFEKAINTTSTIIQTLAIFIGGLWAYHKFAWDKKAESAIKVKALLMEYEKCHTFAASQYQVEINNKENELSAWMKYAATILGPRNQVVSQIHLSCYLPKKLRKKIFDIVWLTVGNAHGENRKHLNNNWKKFGDKLKEIKEELDDIASKL